MKAELLLLGMRFNMAPRSNRRRLVALMYAGLFALIAASWPIRFGGIFSGWILVAAQAANVFVLGGYGFGAKGLLKPFLANDVRARYARDPNSWWSRQCKMNFPHLTYGGTLLNDEREVSRRDGVHWIAYRCLGGVVMISFFLIYTKNGLRQFAPVWVHPPGEVFDRMVYGLLMAAIVLFLTLPQAVLLWTEPDMEADQ